MISLHAKRIISKFTVLNSFYFTIGGIQNGGKLIEEPQYIQ
jgi:hypothetical protein